MRPLAGHPIRVEIQRVDEPWILVREYDRMDQALDRAGIEIAKGRAVRVMHGPTQVISYEPGEP